MSVLFKKQIVKTPLGEGNRRCPVCGQLKTVRDFRTSNFDPATMLTCWQCRHGENSEQASRAEIETVRHDSIFRKKYWAQLLDKRIKKKEVKRMQGEVQAQAGKFLKLPDRIAAIVGKTYTVMGDDFKLADDEAIARIRDLLDELDETLIKRNQKKRLSR